MNPIEGCHDFPRFTALYMTDHVPGKGGGSLLFHRLDFRSRFLDPVFPEMRLPIGYRLQHGSSRMSLADGDEGNGCIRSPNALAGGRDIFTYYRQPFR